MESMFIQRFFNLISHNYSERFAHTDSNGQGLVRCLKTSLSARYHDVKTTIKNLKKGRN